MSTIIIYYYNYHYVISVLVKFIHDLRLMGLNNIPYYFALNIVIYLGTILSIIQFIKFVKL